MVLHRAVDPSSLRCRTPSGTPVLNLSEVLYILDDRGLEPQRSAEINMNKKAFITEVHPSNYTASGARLLLQKYGLSAFDLVNTAEEADVVLYVDYGYVGVTDIVRLIERLKLATHAMHFMYCESDWPFPILPGAYPSLTKPYPWAHGWAFLLRTGVEEEAVGEPAPDLLFSFLGRARTHAIRREIVAFNSSGTPCLDVSSAHARFTHFDYSTTYVELIKRS
jgi:hypothetical protein